MWRSREVDVPVRFTDRYAVDRDVKDHLPSRASPSADVGGVSPVPVKMWRGWAQSQCRDVGGVNPVPAPMWRITGQAARHLMARKRRLSEAASCSSARCMPHVVCHVSVVAQCCLPRVRCELFATCARTRTSPSAPFGRKRTNFPLVKMIVFSLSATQRANDGSNQGTRCLTHVGRVRTQPRECHCGTRAHS
jgi:hypothetical protein